MRLRIISTVFRKELREMLRDRRSLAIMFGIPLLLYPLLTLAISGMATAKTRQYREQQMKVAIINPSEAPHLTELMSKSDSGVEIIATNSPEADLAAKKLDAIVMIPKNAQADSLAARDAEIQYKLDRSRTETGFTERKLDKLLDEYEKWIIQQRLKSRGVSEKILRPVKHTTIDIASASQRFGKLLAMMLPVLLLITGMLGALFPALNATTTERELGTMETLLVSPAARIELLVAKGGIVLLSGLLTAALNMLSMSLVLWRSVSMLDKDLGSLTISPGDLVLSYIAAVPTLITFSIIVLMVGLIARNFREANSLATPVMLIPMLSMIVGIAEPKISPGLLVTPVANTTIIIREVLTGQISAGPFIIALASSCLYAGLMLSLAARLFSSEQLVNPAWEPVSLKGLRRMTGPRRRRLPAVDEAFALFALTLLLTFYVAPSLRNLDLIKLTFIVEVLLIAAPAILFAWLGRYRIKETFSLRNPGAMFLIAALLIGVGATPWVELLMTLQSQIWPPGPEYQRAISELFLPALMKHPVLLPIVIGVLAGTCEEILYRGPLQAGLLRRMPKWVAISIGAVLFAAAHLDLHGMPLRILMGLFLGWLVVASGSIFPAMIAHGVYDATALLTAAYAITHGQAGDLTGTAVVPVVQWDVAKLAVGAIALLAGSALLWAAKRKRDRNMGPGFPVSIPSHP